MHRQPPKSIFIGGVYALGLHRSLVTAWRVLVNVLHPIASRSQVATFSQGSPGLRCPALCSWEGLAKGGRDLGGGHQLGPQCRAVAPVDGVVVGLEGWAAAQHAHGWLCNA